MKLSPAQKIQFIETTKATNNSLYASAMGYLKRKLGNRKAAPSVEETYNAIHRAQYGIDRAKANQQAFALLAGHDFQAERQDWHEAGFDA